MEWQKDGVEIEQKKTLRREICRPYKGQLKEQAGLSSFALRNGWLSLRDISKARSDMRLHVSPSRALPYKSRRLQWPFHGLMADKSTFPPIIIPLTKAR